MKLDLEGKSALVVGASRGIGRSVALSLARLGATVTAVARTVKSISTLMSEMGGEERGHCGIVKDLVPEEAPRQLFTQIEDRGKTIDIVVHSLGGTLGAKDPFCPLTEWRSVSRLNFEIAVELNRYLIPPMQRRKWGRVVHISSIAATLARGSIAYGVAKAALNAYTKNLGSTVAPDGVVVTSVMPGAVRFENNPWDVLAKEQPEKAAAYLNERMAIKRFAKPEEISDFVVFLCSDRSNFFTGCVLPIDGGSW